MLQFKYFYVSMGQYDNMIIHLDFRALVFLYVMIAKVDNVHVFLDSVCHGFLQGTAGD